DKAPDPVPAVRNAVAFRTIFTKMDFVERIRDVRYRGSCPRVLDAEETLLINSFYLRFSNQARAAGLTIALPVCSQKARKYNPEAPDDKRCFEWYFPETKRRLKLSLHDAKEDEDLWTYLRQLTGLEDMGAAKAWVKEAAQNPWMQFSNEETSLLTGTLIRWSEKARAAGLLSTTKLKAVHEEVSAFAFLTASTVGFVKCCQLGRVQEVGQDGSLQVGFDLSFDNQSLSFLGKDLVNLEEVVSSYGHPVGSFLRCIVLGNHGDGFLDILCQDGRQVLYVDAAFVRQLPLSHVTDLGYSSSVTPSGPAVVIKTSAMQRASNQIGLRIAQLLAQESPEQSQEEQLAADAYTSSQFELPPAGFRRSTSVVSSGFFAVGSALRAARLLCPYMQIQVGECNFTSRDVVFDLGKGVGVEMNSSLGRTAEQHLHKYGHRARVVIADVRNVDMREATAVTSFFLSHSFNAEGSSLKEYLSKTLQPGCLVLNYTYPVLGWQGSYSNGVYRYEIGQHLSDPGK
ncbi:unnamed protein product, partial [Polarella glacialis]